MKEVKEDGENVFKKFHPALFNHTYKHTNKVLAAFQEEQQKKAPPNSFSEILSQPPDSYEAHILGDTIERFWLEELKKRKRPSLLRALLKASAFEFSLSLVLNILIRCVCIIITYEILRGILIIIDELTDIDVNYVNEDPFLVGAESNRTAANSTESVHKQELYQQVLLKVVLILSSLTIYMVGFSYSKLERTVRGVKCRVALSQLIFRKSQRLKFETSIRQSSGVALDLISNEVTMVEEANQFVVSAIYGPIILFSGTLWLGYTICGMLPIFASYLFMLLPLAIQLYLPKVYARLTKSRSRETKRRVEVTGAFVNSIKVAKMYNWERVFRDMIESIRNRELLSYRKLDHLYVFEMMTIGFLMRLLPTVMYVLHIFLYGELNTVVLVVGSASYQYFVVEGLIGLTKGFRSAVDFSIACRKIQNFLTLPERVGDMSEKLVGEKCDIDCHELVLGYSSAEQDQELGLEGRKEQEGELKSKYVLSRALTMENHIVEKLSVHMSQGQLVMVIGQVGAGKTTLLLSLLGELRPLRGRLQVAAGCRRAYASQVPWILSDTIKNNILLGRKLDPERYGRVLEACSLVRDLSLMQNGDETLVGSKGVSLSGGQKARVNLARAVYGEADVYLLDDPLSAVDSSVSKHLFSECFGNFLKGKLVVLATHQRQYTHKADQIIALERGARPKVGSFEQISRLCQSLLTSMDQEKAKAEPKAPEAPEQQAPAIDELIGEPELEGAGLNRLAEMVAHKQTPSPYNLLLKMGFTRLSLSLALAAYAIYIPLNGFIDYYLRLWRNKIIEDSQNSSMKQSQFVSNLFIGCALYLAISAVGCFLLSFYQLQVLAGLRKASANLHRKLMDTLFAAKMSFYDFCPSGTLGARYAADFVQIDHVLKPMIMNVVQMISWVGGFVIFLVVMQPICGCLYLILYFGFGPTFLKSFRTLMLLSNLNKQLRAPLYSQIAPVVDELDTLRSDPSYLEYVDRKFQSSQNKLTTMSLLTILYESRLTTLLKVPMILITIASYYVIFVYDKEGLEAAKTGVAFMMIADMNFFLPLIIEGYTTTDSSVRSVDSVQQLFDLEPEETGPVRAVEQPARQAGSLLERGKIEFKGVSLRYFEDEKAVLSELSFLVEGGQRVGVVGRTGAGKSSIVSLLFRLYPFEGTIEIDGIDTKSLTLAELRASLGVIPQDPILFSDSLRKNLDPFDQYTDEQLWNALEVVELRKHVASSLANGLDYQISDGGRNFSVGQRQLVCLARAVLKSPRVLLMDEATANVDQETDLLIQRTIKRHFVGSTVITIAHRLNTILDYDRVLVLDAGRIVEFDTVEALLSKQNGLFKTMLANSTISG